MQVLTALHRREEGIQNISASHPGAVSVRYCVCSLSPSCLPSLLLQHSWRCSAKGPYYPYSSCKQPARRIPAQMTRPKLCQANRALRLLRLRPLTHDTPPCLPPRCRPISCGCENCIGRQLSSCNGLWQCSLALPSSGKRGRHLPTRICAWRKSEPRRGRKDSREKKSSSLSYTAVIQSSSQQVICVNGSTAN